MTGKGIFYRIGLRGNKIRVPSVAEGRKVAIDRSKSYTKNIYLIKNGLVVSTYKNGVELGNIRPKSVTCLACGNKIDVAKGRGRLRKYCNPRCGIDYRAGVRPKRKKSRKRG